MELKKLLIVIGARPNYLKAWPLLKAFDCQKNYFKYELVHSGQHYDNKMASEYIDQLGFPKIDHQFKIDNEVSSVRFSQIFKNMRALIKTNNYDGMIVFGDVNTTVAAATAASFYQIKIFHVESGLRSGDIRMPEEVNRIVVDNLSDLHFVSERSGLQNLKREGFDDDRIFYVGNTMISTLLINKTKIDKLKKQIKNKIKIDYALVTIHRAENIYDLIKLKK